jgi:hypothetical protein
MLPINKIFVDSRFKTDSSQSSSDFKIELSESVVLGESIGASIVDVNIPHTWYTIEENINDRIFVRHYSALPIQFSDNIITLDAKNYDIQTLLTEILFKLNENIGGFTGSLDMRKGNITINIASGRFNIFTDKDLQNLDSWDGPYYDKYNLRYVNDLLKNDEFNNKTYSPLIPFVSGFIDVYTHHNIYITSSQLGTFQI